MAVFFIYIIKVAVLTAAFGILYHYLLKNETFHRFNRIVLAVSLLLAYILPLCVISLSKSGRTPQPEIYIPFSSQVYDRTFVNLPGQSSIVEYNTQDSPTQDNPEFEGAAAMQAPKSNIVLTIIFIIYAAGLAVVIGSRIASALKVNSIIRKGRMIQSTDKWNVVVAGSDIQPFSWMKDVVLPDDPSVINDPVILEHEKAHIAFGHSYELLIFDIITFVQWFNPAVWQMRRDLCAVHEFQVDAAVLEKGYDRKQYQYSLLSHAVGLQAIAMVCGFRLNSLRDRIGMMNRPASPLKKIAKIIYIPLVALAVILIWAKKNNYVDMGTGVLWATCNLGADAPEELGDYFAWGETKKKKSYSLDNYAWKDSSAHIPLLPKDDAATAKLGREWRIPTHVEWEELLNSCNRIWVSMNGTEGLLLESKINGNTLFLPASGSRLDDRTTNNAIGTYWTNTAVDEFVNGFDQWELYGRRRWISNTMSNLHRHRTEKALPADRASMVYFDSIDLTITDDFRYAGLSIRPVKAGFDKSARKKNLERMSEKKRNSKLTTIARDAILEVGPDYYREDSVPVINGPKTFSWKDWGEEPYIEQEGRRYYWVTYPYDNEKEEIKIAKPFTAEVLIWADNGEIGAINFGNGMGYNFFQGNTYEHSITNNTYPNLDYDKPYHEKIHMPFQYQQYHSAKISEKDRSLSDSPLTYIWGYVLDSAGNPVNSAAVMVVDSLGQNIAVGTSNITGYFMVAKNDILRDTCAEFRMCVIYSGVLCAEQTIKGKSFDITLEE